MYMQDKDHVMAALENRNQFIGQFNVRPPHDPIQFNRDTIKSQAFDLCRKLTVIFGEFWS